MNQPNGGWQPPQSGQNFGQPAQPPQQQQQYPMQQHQQAPPVAAGTQMPPGMPQPDPQQGMPQPGQQMGMGMPDNSNPFQGMTSGDQSGGARYPFLGSSGKGDDAVSFNGDYKLKIVGLKFKRTRQSNKPNYIVEAEIMESNQPERPPGMICSIFIDLGNPDTGFRHLAAFLASVYGYEPTKLPKDSQTAPWNDEATGHPAEWMATAMRSIQADQPFVGHEVGCHVTQIILGNGKPWSLHTWVPISALTVPPSPPPLLIQKTIAPMMGQGGQMAGQMTPQPPPEAINAQPQQQYAPQGPPPLQLPQGQQYAPQGPPQAPPQQQGFPQPQQAPQGSPPQGGPPAPPLPTGSWG